MVIRKLIKGAPKRAVSGGVRLLPAVMVTLGVVMGLKAVAVAEAVSSDVADAAKAAPAHGAASEKADPAAAAPPAGPSCPPAPSFADQAGLSQSEIDVLQALGERRKQLDERAASMDDETQLLNAAEQRVAARLAELKKVEKSVQGLLGQLDAQEAERIAGLVNIYQKMKAKDAARIFNSLDEEVLLQVASRMKQTNLAEIMGAMSPDRARALTKAMAQSKKPADAASLLKAADAVAPIPADAPKG